MGSLFTTLLNSTGALKVYGRSFNVIQNNITNANTPGYVKQDQVLVSMPFNLERGLSGGVLPGPVLNSRSSFLEQSVRAQNELLGHAKQRATDLGVVESQFDLTSSFGVASALNSFFTSFSQLAVNPNDSLHAYTLYMSYMPYTLSSRSIIPSVCLPSPLCAARNLSGSRRR